MTHGAGLVCYDISARRKFKPCQNCNGTGEVRINDQHGDEIDECPDCEGEGQLDEMGYAPSYSREFS